MTSSRVLKGKPYSLINLIYNSIFIYLLFTFTWPFSGTVGDIRHALNIVFGLYARQRRIFLRYREPKLRSEFRHILVFFQEYFFENSHRTKEVLYMCDRYWLGVCVCEFICRKYYLKILSNLKKTIYMYRPVSSPTRFESILEAICEWKQKGLGIFVISDPSDESLTF